MGSSRASVVLVHDEPGIVDLLHGLFDAHGLAVDARATLDDALERIARDDFDVVVTAWDQALGLELYRRALEMRREVRHRFVFVIDEIPSRLADVAARGRLRRLDDLPGLLAAVDASVLRQRGTRARTRLLLVDGDPDQLAAMADLLAAEDFDVSTAPGARVAIALLERAAYDVVLSEWSMSDGSGDELHAWIATERPELLPALVFMTGGDVAAVSARVAVPVLPKGQDSPPLLAQLRRAPIDARFAIGTRRRG
jgi:DNA-binding NtrC family response regulator